VAQAGAKVHTVLQPESPMASIEASAVLGPLSSSSVVSSPASTSASAHANGGSAAKRRKLIAPELLEWVNTTLSLSLTRVEQVVLCCWSSCSVSILGLRPCQAKIGNHTDLTALYADCGLYPQFGNGAVFCQLIDAYHGPGVVAMNKVVPACWARKQPLTSSPPFLN
jgi:hypothetical protein